MEEQQKLLDRIKKKHAQVITDSPKPKPKRKRPSADLIRKQLMETDAMLRKKQGVVIPPVPASIPDPLPQGAIKKVKVKPPPPAPVKVKPQPEESDESDVFYDPDVDKNF